MGVYSLTKSSIKNWVKYPNMMAGSAYLTPASDDLITQTVLASAAASVTFDVSTLAAQGYKHLQLRVVARDVSATADNVGLLVRFNSDTATNYGRHRLRGDGTSTTSSSSLTQTSINVYTAATGGGATASSFGVGIIDVLDFASSVKNKTTRALTGFHASAGNAVELDSGLWLSTAAITQIDLLSGSGSNLAIGSRFSLYASKG